MSKILIADDEQDAANTLAALLKLEKHDVRVAYDGQSAYDIAIEFLPDILILDLMMPNLNGFQVAERLRAMSAFNDKLFVAISALSHQRALDQASKAQFDEYLVKPCKIRVLLDVLREVPS